MTLKLRQQMIDWMEKYNQNEGAEYNAETVEAYILINEAIKQAEGKPELL